MTVSVPSLVSANPTENTAPRGSANAASVKGWWVEAVDRHALEPHKPAWEILAKSAVEPNVFYEPWMFLPAVQTYDPNKPLCCVLVYRLDPGPKKSPQMCGFFPFERRRMIKGLPGLSLKLWDHLYVNLCTPLIHRDWTRETLHHLFDWVKCEERCSLLDLPKIHGDGPFHHALLDLMRERRLLSYVAEIYVRAMIRRGADAESYSAAATNHLSRKEWNRQRRRLSEQGTLQTRVLAPKDDVESWIDQFLLLEASGWKGREKTALAVSETDRAYFRTITLNAFARGQLHMLGLYLDDRPIALKCNFLSGDGGFTFKIAFHESYAKYSPGVQLELDNIEDMHRRPGLQWMDSCAIPGHFMINRLWKEQRVIQRLLLATSRWVGNSVVGLLPMLQALKRMLRN
jgi:Acetyltransferase (GNAT) domain